MRRKSQMLSCFIWHEYVTSVCKCLDFLNHVQYQMNIIFNLHNVTGGEKEINKNPETD